MKHAIHKLILIAFILAGCSERSPQSTPSTQQPQSSAAPTNRIDIPAIVRSNLGITFAKVERRVVGSTIRIPGSFETHPRARHEYRLTLPGVVELHVDQYQAVEEGDLLYRFRSPEWPELQHEIILGEQQIQTSNAQIAVAESKIDEAQQRLEILRERLATLAEAEFREAGLEMEAAQIQASIPRLQAELVEAQTRLSNAEKTHEHALHRAAAATGIVEEQLAETTDHQGHESSAYASVDWIEVRATSPGIVELLALTDGAFADATTLVVSTIDPQRVRFRASALQSDMSRITGGISARIVGPSSPALESGDTVEASITIGLEAHPEQRTLSVLATPAETKPWARPGVSAFLEIVTESTSGYALAIPKAAIVKDGLVHVFFRRDPKDPNLVIRVEADMGVSDGRWVAINSGLAPNDQVVLHGAYELKLASQQSGGQQEGVHVHADGTVHTEH